MGLKVYYRFVAIFALIGLIFSTPAWAGGLALYELGTPDVGTAAAGWSARAQDASTAFTNPAGMTRLERSQMLAGVQPLYINAEFDTDSSTFGGGDGGNAGGWVPAAGLYYVHDLTQEWKLGVAAASYFGLGLDYNDKWAGRYYVTKAELLTFGITPTVAYQVNSWLSIGAGPSFIYGRLEQKAAINNAVAEGDPNFSDGRIEAEDDDFGFGGIFGVLIEPREGTRFGATYLTKVDLEFKDVAKLKNLGPTLSGLLAGVRGSKVDLELTVPQMLMVSGYHELTDDLAILANLGWQDWSEFGKTQVTVSSATTTELTQDRNFKDTWHLALGAQYRFLENWLWSVGFAYDSSPVDRDDRTPDVPVDRQIRYATGLQYDWGENVTLGAAYEYLDAGDAKIDQEGGPLQGDLKGDYKTNEIHFINLNLIWRF
jgi:long-chain fatty acid transport protein